MVGFGAPNFLYFSLLWTCSLSKLGFTDKVALGRPLGQIFDRLLVVFCMLFETDKHLVGEIVIHPGTHSVGTWVVGFSS